MNKIFLGIIFFLIGAGFALGMLFANGKKEPKFEPTKFSLDQAPSDSIKGQITNLTGEIWWQSRTATEPAELKEAIEIQQGETLIASESGNLTIEFSPAATVSLFPETQIEIVQTMPLNLVFNQTKGVGQYQVFGSSPVTVRSLNLIVNLEDGLLVVDTDEETGQIILGLKTGKAKVAYNSPEFDSKVWELEPGDVFEYDSNERRGYFSTER